jgi:glycosyltransferase involved in cell wall biosynthesis
MSYRVIIYCPDRHLTFDADMPDRQGIGGGIMARIRLAQALSRQGCQVTVISNLRKAQRHQNVNYLPLTGHNYPTETDILILTTSGDQLSLEEAINLKIQAKLRQVWVHGTPRIKGLEQLEKDELIPVSTFLYNVIQDQWGLQANQKIFTIYNGATRVGSKQLDFFVRKDPYSLVYASHPSKGLNAALSVLRLVREQEPRFKLHVFGGDALWGGIDKHVVEEGLFYHGTQGQKTVLKSLTAFSFSINLQQRLEPFGMALTEAMLHGCIPLASPVGAYSELIRDGWNGFLITGDPESKKTHQKAADLVLRLTESPDFSEYIRRNARHIHWTWDNQAKVWLQHWAWRLEKKGHFLNEKFRCYKCKANLLLMADGYHCPDCGRYYLEISIA